MGIYCDDSIPPSHVSSSNEVLIQFQSDGSVTEAGFQMEYNPTGNTSIQNNTEYHGDRLLGALVICIWLFYIELFKIAPLALFFLTHMVYMANGTCKLTKIPFRFSKYNM